MNLQLLLANLEKELEKNKKMIRSTGIHYVNGYLDGEKNILEMVIKYLKSE